MPTTLTDVEFIDCATFQIQYDTTGRATASFAVVKNNLDSIDINQYKTFTVGGVAFDGVVVNLTQQPIVGSEGWAEWHVQFQGVGN